MVTETILGVKVYARDTVLTFRNEGWQGDMKSRNKHVASHHDNPVSIVSRHICNSWNGPNYYVQAHCKKGCRFWAAPWELKEITL